jgi:hypothetical protein
MKVYDINPEMVERFANDTKALTSGAAVEAAGNVRDAAEDSDFLGRRICGALTREVCSCSSSICRMTTTTMILLSGSLGTN